MRSRSLLGFALGAVGIAAGMHLATRYRRDLEHARRRFEPLRRIAETRCGRIEYAMVGEGIPLLLVHGAGGGYDQGLDFGLPFAQRDFRVIAMSRFGYLGTPLPGDAGAAAQADAHAALLDALEIGEAAIVGASAGAPSALQFALRHPSRCKALVLVGPAAFVPRPGGAASLSAPAATEFIFDTALRSDFLFWIAIHAARPALVRGLLATRPGLLRLADADDQARAAQMLLHILPVSSRRLGLLNDAEVTTSLPRYDLERIAAPTLVASVADDLFGTYDVARYTAEHIPGARFLGFRSGGHVWIGHHRQLQDAITAFLREAGATPTP
jgi:pimeloyl-ACP methyl ester carboxylesterase